MRHIRVCIAISTVMWSSGCGDDSGGTDDGMASTAGSSSTAGPVTATTQDTTSDPVSSTGLPDPSTGPMSSTGAMDSTGPSATDGSDSTGAALGDPVFVAVGYGGMRVRSVDDGNTWDDYVQIADNGGDDQDLLRGVAWGNGTFVAVGWTIFTSPDGATWTEQQNPTGQWFAAVDWGNDVFVAVGGGGYCGRSADGQTWQECTDATDDGGFTHVRSLFFHDGLFWTADQNGVLRSSPNGDVWTVEDADFGSPNAYVVDGSVVPVDDQIPADFDTARLTGSAGGIQRADPGSDMFADVYTVPGDNNVFHTYRFSFAVGYP